MNGDLNIIKHDTKVLRSVPASGSEGSGSGDGNIRIKCVENQAYWWVWEHFGKVITANQLNEKDRSLFKPIKASDTFIALKYLNNNLFCSTYYNNSNDGTYLSDDESSISKKTHFVVKEAVLNRKISITYRLEDAMIYDVPPVTLCTDEHENDDDQPLVKTVTLNYKTELTTSWETMNSWTVGIKATVEVKTIPLVSKASIELSAEYAGSYTWGETKTEGQDFSDSNEYTVRGKHKLIVSKVASKGYCDVPYLYTQTDTMYDGQVITVLKTDGVYRGVNYFDISTVSDQIPI